MKTVVAFLARKHGLNGLQALVHSNQYRVAAIFTHRLMPKSEDPARSEREEYKEFQRLAEEHHIPLYAIDNKADMETIDRVINGLDIDLIVSISWRRLVPLSHLQAARIGAINLHRGKLPEYPGAEPIKQALHHGDKTIEITAHLMTEEIDKGEILAVYKHAVNYQENKTLEENIQRLKDELTPHFGPLLIEACNLL